MFLGEWDHRKLEKCCERHGEHHQGSERDPGQSGGQAGLRHPEGGDGRAEGGGVDAVKYFQSMILSFSFSFSLSLTLSIDNYVQFKIH